MFIALMCVRELFCLFYLLVGTACFLLAFIACFDATLTLIKVNRQALAQISR